MCSNSAVIIPRPDPCFSFLPTRPDIIPFPASVSFRIRTVFHHGPSKSIPNDTVHFSDPATLYDLLGIPETGTLLEIKQAYKQLARKYHPDVSPHDRVEEYTKMFIRVQEAYETLSDPRRRALYDRDMLRESTWLSLLVGFSNPMRFVVFFPEYLGFVRVHLIVSIKFCMEKK
ncbi:Hypothetical predicted protein [Olea europaea subsp. europaea]|uniref:J domain-containing protein n=2 Tax=Olea europaea subsp. europaea TaxID=158383 RepID=A0A8S0TBL8_OLEEU|nr:Hypothetical predicted protein [Olea europaea subsp. europaea]